MATATNQRTDSVSESISSQPGTSHSGRGFGQWLFLGLILAGVLGGGFVLVPQLAGFSDSEEASGALTHEVKRGRMQVVVTEDGNVESASNLEVKCQIAGGSSILWIVEDGKIVKEGDEVVRLDQSSLDDQLNSQRIVFEKALAAKIQAEQDYETSIISVKEYKEGIYKKELQDADANIVIAMESLRSAENLLKHTTRMARKGFATPLQLEADKFAVQRSNLELQSAKTAKTVLEDFTYQKTLKELEAKRDASEAKKRSETAGFDLEKARLDRLQDQLKYCVITAPQSGMVVYANNQSRRMGQSQPQVEEGAMVREGQDIIQIPDLTRMQVKVTVHESKVDQLSIGMPARIKIQDKDFDGSVVSIANQPEPGSFFSANVKEYATTVAIDGETKGLKPGMTAEVTVLIADLENVVTVPVAAVVEQGGKFYSWVEDAKGPSRRQLVLGQTNDRDIEVKDGLKERDVVLLNPRAVVPEAREEELQVDENDNKSFKKGKKTVGVGGSGKGSPSQGKSKKSGGKGKGKSGRSFNLMQYDKDGDGKVSKEEAPAQMQAFFGRIDTNGDGFIDKSEVSAAAARRRQGGGMKKGGRPGGGRPE